MLRNLRVAPLCAGARAVIGGGIGMRGWRRFWGVPSCKKYKDEHDSENR